VRRKPSIKEYQEILKTAAERGKNLNHSELA
jgi:hypothetical protein